MHQSTKFDAVVVGAGPNGLAASVELAREGYSVCLLEARETVGGGARSAELAAGIIYDICSAIHPLAAASPFMKGLPLETYGLRWVHPPIPLAHPFDDGQAACLHRSLSETAEGLGSDARTYERLMNSLVTNWGTLAKEILAPLHIPRHPFRMAAFALKGFRSAAAIAARLEKREARGLFAGLAAHSFLPLDQPPSAAFGLLLGTLAHVIGWPFPRQGAQKIADAMADYFKDLGGEVVTNHPVFSFSELPEARVFLFDLTPRQVLEIAGERFSKRYRRSLEKYRYGPGVFKLDLIVSRPIPWQARACRQAGTVHLGGEWEEIAAAEAAVFAGRPPERPFVLLAQQSRFDPTRVCDDRQVVWAYTHVPNGSTVDMSGSIEKQIERFAPGFEDTILHRQKTFPADLQTYNPNCVGGDINGGLQDLGQLFTRPTARVVPYSTSADDIFICSSSTPPGGGVHGMCGYHAAQAVIRRLRA